MDSYLGDALCKVFTDATELLFHVNESKSVRGSQLEAITLGVPVHCGDEDDNVCC